MHLNALESSSIPHSKTVSLIYMTNKARCTFEGINTFRLIVFFVYCFLHFSRYIFIHLFQKMLSGRTISRPKRNVGIEC